MPPGAITLSTRRLLACGRLLVRPLEAWNAERGRVPRTGNFVPERGTGTNRNAVPNCWGTSIRHHPNMGVERQFDTAGTRSQGHHIPRDTRPSPSACAIAGLPSSSSAAAQPRLAARRLSPRRSFAIAACRRPAAVARYPHGPSPTPGRPPAPESSSPRWQWRRRRRSRRRTVEDPGRGQAASGQRPARCAPRRRTSRGVGLGVLNRWRIREGRTGLLLILTGDSILTVR
jgi:hypothetical protein